LLRGRRLPVVPLVLLGVVVASALAVAGLRFDSGPTTDEFGPLPGLVSTVGCRPADEAPTEGRWVLDGRTPTYAADWEPAEVVLLWCDEVVVRQGASIVTVRAGGPATPPHDRDERLLDDEAEVRRVGGTSVEVRQRRGHPTTAAWMVGDAVVVAHADVPAAELAELAELVDSVTVSDRRLVPDAELALVERGEPDDWMLAGAERSSVTYDLDGEEVTVETARRPIDASSVFGGDSEPTAERVGLADGGQAWLFTAPSALSRVLALSIDGHVVQVKGHDVPESTLVDVAGRLAQVDDARWGELVSSVRRQPPGQIQRDIDRNVVRDVVAYLGPLVIMGGLVWLLVRLVDRRRG
jgi:hypothetical protein